VEITLRDVYDEVKTTQGGLTTLAAQLSTHAATTTARLDSGQRDLEDHESRLRVLEGRVPADLSGQVASLQKFRWSLMGAAGSIGALSGVVAALITSGHG
jgi:hypothetical protein